MQICTSFKLIFFYTYHLNCFYTCTCNKLLTFFPEIKKTGHSKERKINYPCMFERSIRNVYTCRHQIVKN